MSELSKHLSERGLKKWHHCWCSGELPESPMEEHVVFPLFAAGGRFIGHQRYFWRRPKLGSNSEQGRSITTFLPEYKLSGLYGLDNCYGYGPLFVTEGIWDSIRVVNCYVDCLAILSNCPNKQLKGYLRMQSRLRPVVSLMDRDENMAGERLSHAFDYSFFPAYGYEDFNAMPHDVCFRHMTNILKEIKS